MIDWFVVLIPAALLPIVLHFFFLGCAEGQIGGPCPATDTEIRFEIEFFLVNNGQERLLEFRILQGSVQLASFRSGVGNDEVDNGNPLIPISRQFTECLPPDFFALTCEVWEIFGGDVSNSDRLIADGDTCVRDYQQSKQYRVHFVAEVRNDGTTPESEFERCEVDEY